MFDLALFRRYEDEFSKEKNGSFELIAGMGRVMISAPHSVQQTRNGKIKRAEEQTGPFAKMLHDELNCPIIFKTKNCNDDANYDPSCDYKDAIVEYISTNNIDFVLDLHLLSAKRDIMVDIGTGGYNNVRSRECVEIVKEAFMLRDVGLVEIDKPFSAKSPRTISAFVSKSCGISALQIELNSRLVYSGFDTAKPDVIYDALREIVLKLQNCCEKQ